MMSDLATAAEMMEIDELRETGQPDAVDNPGAADGGRRQRAQQIVEEILANALSRDRTRGIGF
jgi:hypothetical protein